jgi:HTH-type transcriptional regulator/antitoxin HigA
MAKKVIRLLRSEADYDAALDEIEGYFDRPPEPGTPEADRFDLLALVIEDYERKHWPVDPPGPIDAIRFQMDVRGYSQADLGRVLGSRRRASEILSGRRPLTMQMAWTLHREWGIPAETLIQPQAPVRPRGRNASSVIQDFSYDARRQKLKIVFQTGRVYVYERVPAEVHAGLKNAPSQGAYFNNSIRDHFPCREIMPAG